jgi:MOSC domain-containing protein YiiM
MRIEFRVESVNVSEEKGTQKKKVKKIELIEKHGIKGDAHGGDWHRQVSFLAGESIDRMKEKGLELESGAFGENIVTRGIDWGEVKIGGKVFINDAVLLVTQIGKECHDKCSIFYAAGECIMPSEGAFTRVLKGGKVHDQDRGYYCV